MGLDLLGSLSPGGGTTVTIVAKPNAEGTITNVATIGSALADSVPANNSATNINTVMPLVDLAITATDAPDPVTLSSNLVYTLMVTNRGVSIAPGSVLTDTLPPTATFVSATPSQGSCSATGGVVTCSLGSIAGAANAQVAITVTPTAIGFITNRASISTTTTDVNSTNNSTTISTKVNAPPTISGFANQAINEDTSTGPLSFSVGDLETPAGSLVVTATSSNPALVSSTGFTFSGSGSNRTVSILPLTNQFGTATITLRVVDADNGAAITSFLLTVNAVNDPPTLNALGNVSINEDAGTQLIGLSGISSGATNEIQTLTVTATSSDPSIIPNPTVTYSSPNNTGNLTYTPLFNAFGSVVMTVSVNDNGASNSLVTRTFTVTVNPVNDPPTLNPIPPLGINEDAGLQNISLTGITSGAPNENQLLAVTASTSNPGLLQNLAISYTSPATSGNLSFGTVTNASGTALVTVQVNDGGSSNNIVSQTFTVTVNPVNDAPTLDPIADRIIRLLSPVSVQAPRTRFRH